MVTVQYEGDIFFPAMNFQFCRIFQRKKRCHLHTEQFQLMIPIQIMTSKTMRCLVHYLFEFSIKIR